MRAEPIELRASDGVVLRGQYWPGGEIWLLLLHEPGKDLDCWQPLVPVLNERNYSLLMVDLRGHGASDGEWNSAMASADLATLIQYATEHGAARLGFIGAGVSVMPALINDVARKFIGIVALSPELTGEVDSDELRGGAVPKLFVVGTLEAAVVEAEQKTRDRMIGWTVTLRLPSTQQGSVLASGEWQVHLRENIVAFFEEQRYMTTSGSVRYIQPDTLFRRLQVPDDEADTSGSLAQKTGQSR